MPTTAPLPRPLVMLLLCWVVGCAQAEREQPATSAVLEDSVPSAPREPQRLESQALPNLVQVHDQVFSGGLPEGELAFEELARMGVRSIVSVDGAKPDVEMARAYGMRYVHLPHGYDGIPPARAESLAKAVSELQGPIYIHCHHGRHRSPAAASVACVSAGLIAADQALDVLKLAGTSKNYIGLYSSVAQATRLDAHRLAEIPADFPEVAALAPLAEAMVKLDQVHERLLGIAQAGWQTPANHPDLIPAHEALLLREQFTEMLRNEEIALQPSDFQEMLRSSEQAARQLEILLVRPVASVSPWPQDATTDSLNKQSGQFGEVQPVEHESDRLLQITSAAKIIADNCKACHRIFRDPPREEKQHVPTSQSALHLEY